jgi:hypothetical protein
MDTILTIMWFALYIAAIVAGNYVSYYMDI